MSEFVGIVWECSRVGEAVGFENVNCGFAAAQCGKPMAYRKRICFENWRRGFASTLGGGASFQMFERPVRQSLTALLLRHSRADAKA